MIARAPIYFFTFLGKFNDYGKFKKLDFPEQGSEGYCIAKLIQKKLNSSTFSSRLITQSLVNMYRKNIYIVFLIFVIFVY